MSEVHPINDSPPDRGATQADTVPATARMAKRFGLTVVTRDVLLIGRRRSGSAWTYVGPDKRVIRDQRTIRRLDRLAVPPAYREVLYAADPAAHLQAIGRDAAGRWQYRYHPEWEKVREIRKSRRLARLADVLPRISRSIGQHLGAEELTRGFACSATIDLIARSAIRPGNEAYARLRGTLGAATLLKSNVVIEGPTITLTFRAKGGKNTRKEFECLRLATALDRLAHLPGKRLFQYRDDNGDVRPITTREVNTFLREIAGAYITLKDFRTLVASASVLDALSRAKPASSDRQRRKQVLEAIRAAADELSNTPAICRKSYVHRTVVEAFEDGALERFAQSIKGCRFPKRAQMLAKILKGADAQAMRQVPA